MVQVLRIGNRSRDILFEAYVLCRANPARGASAADVLETPILATRAKGTVVVPVARVESPAGS